MRSSSFHTGWIRDDHTIEVERDEEGNRSYHLNHPDTCKHSGENFGRIEIRNYQCWIGEESTRAGLGPDNHDDEDSLSSVNVPKGTMREISIEYSVYSAYHPSTPMGGEEWDWILTWRFIHEDRDEDLANEDWIKKASGHVE